MDQNLLQQAYLLERQSQELEENVVAINGEIEDLKKFDDSLSLLANSEESSMLSSIGKGVYLKTNLEDKKLFVEVGKKILVKKTSEETQDLVNSQINKLEEAKSKILRKLEIYHDAMSVVINQIEKELSESEKTK